MWPRTAGSGARVDPLLTADTAHAHPIAPAGEPSASSRMLKRRRLQGGEPAYSSAWLEAASPAGRPCPGFGECLCAVAPVVLLPAHLQPRVPSCHPPPSLPPRACRRGLERQRLHLLCLGRLPYDPDLPLHFQLFSAVCWGFTGEPACTGRVPPLRLQQLWVAALSMHACISASSRRPGSN